MNLKFILLAGAGLGLAAVLNTWAASRPAEILFENHMIDPAAYETTAVGDINRDGNLDIVSGENWYEGPRLNERCV